MQSLMPLDSTCQDMKNNAPSRQIVVVKEYSVLVQREHAVTPPVVKTVVQINAEQAA